jgi:hypothetical protein
MRVDPTTYPAQIWAEDYDGDGPMNVKIEVSEKDLRALVLQHVQSIVGCLPITPEQVQIEVKSKQNYKSEWEEAAFRATLNITLSA